MASTSHVLRTIEHVPFHADPVLRAIDAHDEAWSVWQVAPDALVVRRHAEMCEALARLLATPCATHFGALALLRHLRRHIDHDGFTDTAVLARASNLALYLNLGFPPVEPARQSVAPVLRALSRSGELVACLTIMVGGMGLIGLASLIRTHPPSRRAGWLAIRRSMQPCAIPSPASSIAIKISPPCVSAPPR